jgi:PAS domain S-box-containing protein
MNAANSLLLAMLDAAADPVLFVDEHGVITVVNKAADNLGFSPSHPVDQSGLPTGLVADLAAGTRSPAITAKGREFAFRGKTYAISCEPVNEAGRFRGTVVALRDISELKTAQENWRELDAAMKSAYDGIFITDGQGVAIKYNEAYCRITGIDAAELMGLTMDEIIGRGYASESVVLKVLKTRDTATTMPKLRSGKLTLHTASPVFDENGEIVRVISNVRDITELNAIKSQLEQARELSEKYYSEIIQLRSQQAEVKGVITESKAMKNIFSTALKVAATNATVMVTGDSGVGKEVVARTVHKYSEFKDGPFVKINCGAIPDNLLESELFGYEKGAFTSAAKTGKPGLFEIAAGGTVFLDEIGELPMHLQVKLLGVLQDLQFTRVGGVKAIEMKSRIIAATNRNLEDMLGAGKFRRDLYYRLNVVALKIPPLAERHDDILPLAKYFLDKFNQKYGVFNTFSPQVLKLFVKYQWPGNVREMENMIEKLVILSPNEQITIDRLPGQLWEKAKTHEVEEGATLGDVLGKVEADLLRNLLAQGYTTYQMAEKLGINQSTVVRKLQKLKIDANKNGKMP